jgi:hypothetical protein
MCNHQLLLTHCWDWPTICKTIARITNGTGANGWVIDNATIRIASACSWTRIDTPLVYASALRWAVWADQTFRSTIRGGANHIWKTAALGLSRNHLTLRTGSAWRWCARIRWNGSQCAFFHYRVGYRSYELFQVYKRLKKTCHHFIHCEVT